MQGHHQWFVYQRAVQDSMISDATGFFFTEHLKMPPHRITKEALWLDDGWYNSTTEVKHVGKEENDKDSKTMCLLFMTLLKACALKKDLHQGSRIHADICDNGLLEKNPYLGNALVNMYAKCGALVRAQQVLDELHARDVVSWNALIAGYVQHGQGEQALGRFYQMRSEGLTPNAITYACVLKACAIMKEASIGEQIHEEIVSHGLLEKDVVLGTALIDMYAKCAILKKAQKVLDKLCIRNVVSWNALIVGYVQQRQGREALGCCKQMQSEGISPDAITYACILKACAITQEVGIGKHIHDEIVRQRLLEKNVVLGNALVDMYAKCGVLTKAQKVLDEQSVQDVVSWNTLIAGYVQQEQAKQALYCFQQMQRKGFSPDAITYVCILKACGSTQQADMGKQIHDEIVSQGLLEKNVVLGTVLVDMYAKCGILAKAKRVLDELAVQDVVSWNAIITGYVQQGQGQEAVACFQQMKVEGFSPNAITYACILKACSITQQADMGKQIHDEIVSQGLLKKDVVLGTALVSMYAKCGVLPKAQKVLDGLPVRDVIAWSALIAGYVQQGKGEDALGCFQQMQSEGLFPDAITYACILKACGITQQVDMGKQIHEEIVNRGLLEKSVVLGNALVGMYVKCGALKKAQKVLGELLVRNAISWNALIAGYAQQGQGEDALGFFQQMQSEGFLPDAVTYACILKACGITQQVDRGKQIHDEIVSQGLLEKDVVLITALIDMYAKCGILTEAQKVLDELPVRNVIAWNALIAGFIQQGHGQEALACFQRMQNEGLSPDAITYACTLKACSITQQADMGKQIHEEIVGQGLLERNVELGNALVDMYAKVGLLTKAQKTLDELSLRDVISWNALIAGYTQRGQNKDALGCVCQMRSKGISLDVVCWNALIGGYAQEGLTEEALDCFHWMQKEGTFPNAITFIHVLNACSRSGLVDEGQMYFENMTEKYDITPNKEHYTCMVDLLGLARDFEKALSVIKMMPSSDYPPVWFALQGACQKWGNVSLGRFAFEHAVQLDGCHAAKNVSMANICVAAGISNGAARS